MYIVSKSADENAFRGRWVLFLRLFSVYLHAITVGDYRTGCSLAFVGPQIKNAAELYAKFYINPTE